MNTASDGMGLGVGFMEEAAFELATQVGYSQAVGAGKGLGALGRPAFGGRQ